MIVLGLDTAQAACSAALLKDGRLLAARHQPMQAGHAEALAPMVVDLLAEAGLAPAALNRIGVTIGPGTFTGLRIGLAFARALGGALECPVVGVTTLAALAAGAARRRPGAGAYLAAIDARRQEIYVQLFAGDLAPLSEPALLPVESLEPVAAALTPAARLVAAGTGAALALAALSCEGEIDADGTLPAAEDVAHLAAALADPANAPARPLYLRAPDAKLLAPRRRRPDPRTRSRS